MVKLNLHFPQQVQYVSQAVNGVLEEYPIDLERQEQTAENIFEVFSGAVYEYHNMIVSFSGSTRSRSSFPYTSTFIRALTLPSSPIRRLC